MRIIQLLPGMNIVVTARTEKGVQNRFNEPKPQGVVRWVEVDTEEREDALIAIRIHYRKPKRIHTGHALIEY